MTPVAIVMAKTIRRDAGADGADEVAVAHAAVMTRSKRNGSTMMIVMTIDLIGTICGTTTTTSLNRN